MLSTRQFLYIMEESSGEYHLSQILDHPCAISTDPPLASFVDLDLSTGQWSKALPASAPPQFPNPKSWLPRPLHSVDPFSSTNLFKIIP